MTEQQKPSGRVDDLKAAVAPSLHRPRSARLRSETFCELGDALQLHYKRVLRSGLHTGMAMSRLRAGVKKAVDGAFVHGRERVPRSGSDASVTERQICIT